jgi:hypothetical protein
MRRSNSAEFIEYIIFGFVRYSPMAKKDPPPRREKLPFIEDSILKETVKKEIRYQKEFTDFCPSLLSLEEATPDKPLVDSFCSRLYSRPDEEDELGAQLRGTLSIQRRDTAPHFKYREPLTTSMEIGWDQYDVPRFKSMFNHNRMKTEITMLPSKWDPNANTMTVKEKPPK